MYKAQINYAARTAYKPRYYANDHSRDTVVIDGRPMEIHDGRKINPKLDHQGFVLVPHISAVADFTDPADVAVTHPDEIVALLLKETGADNVFVTAPGILRFSERSDRAGKLDNSMPARFAHIDITPETALGFAQQSLPAGKKWRRYAHYNVWRSFSGPPQDVGLCVCDASSVDAEDLIIADAIFDTPGKADWGFDGYIVAHNHRHRWHAFDNMTPQEALIFKTSDSEFGNQVPHVAYDNPTAPGNCQPRASIEMRAIAYWYD